jgi:hypothetical protein
VGKFTDEGDKIGLPLWFQRFFQIYLGYLDGIAIEQHKTHNDEGDKEGGTAV